MHIYVCCIHEWFYFPIVSPKWVHVEKEREGCSVKEGSPGMGVVGRAMPCVRCKEGSDWLIGGGTRW